MLYLNVNYSNIYKADVEHFFFYIFYSYLNISIYVFRYFDIFQVKEKNYLHLYELFLDKRCVLVQAFAFVACTRACVSVGYA